MRVTNPFQFVSVVYKAVKDFTDNDVPEKYWREQIKWAFMNGSKDYHTPEERMVYIQDVINECSANYLMDQLNK